MNKLHKTDLFIIFLTLFFSLNSIAFGQENLKNEFTPTQWNNELDTIDASIKYKTWTEASIENTINAITPIQSKSKICVEETQKEINRIEEISNSTQPRALDPTSILEQKSLPPNLDKKRMELKYTQAECQLYFIRSKEVIIELQHLKQELAAIQLFSKKPSVWENISLLPSYSEIYKDIDTQKLLQDLGVFYFNFAKLITLGLTILLSIVLGYYLRFYCIKKLSTIDDTSIICNILGSVFRYSYFMISTLLISIYFILFSWPEVYTTHLATLSLAILSYFLLLTLLNSILYPSLPMRAFISLPGHLNQYLSNRFKYLLAILLIFYSIYIIFLNVLLPIPVTQLFMTLFMTLIGIILTSIIWLIVKIPKLLYEWHYARYIINILMSGVLLCVLMIEWLGYHQFSLYIITNTAISLAFIFFIFILHKILVSVLSSIEQQSRFRYYLDIKPYKDIPEFTVLTFTLIIIEIIVLISLLLKTWGLSVVYFDIFISSILDNFTIAGINIMPSRIMVALIIFSLLSMINRFLRHYLRVRGHPEIDNETQDILSTIGGYIGFSIILIICLVIAGVNFTGLAIIAGALSVGIGFGLQGIVNNFISGLILLLENPIRPGDRINVGGVEGVVKRIRLRATQILTTQRTDVFIPNSDLMTKNVENLMYYNKRWRVECIVGVAYDSDIDKVKELLLSIALQHPDVIQEEPDNPQVIFTTFADNSLTFELRCVVNDVNKRRLIQSDLNFAIKKEFTKHHIEIPFPQREIKVKNWPKTGE